MGFKGFLSESNISLINDILLNFIKKLPLDYIGNIYSNEENDYEDRIKVFLDGFGVKSHINNEVFMEKYAFGSKFYDNVKELHILTNYEDHFLIIYEFKAHSLLKAFSKLEFLMKLFDKTLQEHALTPSYRNGLGFLTINPNFIGLGISLNYSLKLKEKGVNEMQMELNQW